MATEFWLSGRQWKRLASLLPRKSRGVPRVDDRRVISGIVHVLSVREIARRTGHSRNTVERHLKREGPALYTARPAVPGKLDAHKAFVSERMIAAHPERLQGTVLLGNLRARGYTGGITILREHLATLRPVLPIEPVVRFETNPGRQMRVDWAVIRRGGDPLRRSSLY